MNTQDLIRAIHHLKVETGSLACFGCGLEKQMIYAKRLKWLQQPAGGADHG